MKIQSKQNSNLTENNSQQQVNASDALPIFTPFQFTEGNTSGVFQSMVRGGSTTRANINIRTAAQAAAALSQAEGLYNSASSSFTRGNREAARPLVNQAIDLLNQVGRYHNSSTRTLTPDQAGKLNELLTNSLALRSRINAS